ncbi:MAG: hypothetical protein AB7E81_14265 [Hyphomicrobiaceae bacterium]
MARTTAVAVRALGQMVGAAAIATMVTGCGMSSITSGIGGGMFGGGAASKSADKAVTHEQMLSAAKANAPMGASGDVAGGCPRFSVWPRDHHVTIYEQGRIGDGLAVLHRGEITQTARECQIQGTRVTIKYGFSGRVLLGPKGHPGLVTLPVNIFVTDAKRARISTEEGVVDVTVTAEKPVGYFSSVRTLSFDVPMGSRAGEFEVFVGFDQKAPGAG